MFHHTGTAVDFADAYREDAERGVSAGLLTFEQFWFLLGVWSKNTFGPRYRRGPLGPIRHLAKEIQNEVLPLLEAVPADKNPACEPNAAEILRELTDLQFLIWDAVQRAGFTMTQFRADLTAKLIENRNRRWPAPSSDQPVEHVRETESNG